MPEACRRSAWMVILLMPVLVQAESPEPMNVPPRVGPLCVEADDESGNVSLEWTGGSPPFAVVRADHRCFRDAEHVWVLESHLEVRNFVDSGALRLGTRMYYQVYDANSVPEAHWVAPDGGLPGQEITVRGAGFDSDCSKNSVYIAGSAARVIDCSFIHLVFVVPEDSITGSVIVATPTGGALVGDSCTEVSRKPATWKEAGPYN